MKNLKDNDKIQLLLYLVAVEMALISKYLIHF